MSLERKFFTKITKIKIKKTKTKIELKKNITMKTLEINTKENDNNQLFHELFHQTS